MESPNAAVAIFYVDREPPEGEQGGAAVLRDGSSNDLLSGDLPRALRICITSGHIPQHLSLSHVLHPSRCAVSAPGCSGQDTSPKTQRSCGAEGGEQRELLLLGCWCQSQTRQNKFRSTATATVTLPGSHSAAPIPPVQKTLATQRPPEIALPYKSAFL